ncbi:hypothetical protein GCM10008959_16800 [Deinococcus seoulensis]|uniref:Uncharacterized protein n=2 Tax=Deinococcus TaxID=1298 RepID=A0ABQ2RRZ3_9DEIO|nr:hypothetical protein GCM10008959_16800 [Deinococcus seoulensis]GGS17353.1 hypothetical protein GCM10008961_06340 [Deinococcus knuensis]
MQACTSSSDRNRPYTRPRLSMVSGMGAGRPLEDREAERPSENRVMNTTFACRARLRDGAAARSPEATGRTPHLK